jgi:hypothetical protein
MMRLRTIVLGVLALAGMAGCGNTNRAAPAQATGTLAAQLQRPASAVSTPAIAASGATTAPSPPPPTEQPTAPAPTASAIPPAPTLRATPVAPAGRAPVAAPTPQHSSAIAPPYSQALATMIDAAKADLAQRQAVSPESIELVAVWSVVWPDGSLGCSRPGMLYPQVQVDGLLIRFRIGERVFDYHGDGRRAPFLCEQQPMSDSPAPPGSDR